MIVRSLLFTILAAGSAAAQGPVKPGLPGIVPNVKWTINQNAAQLLLNVDVQKDLALSAATKSALLKVYANYESAYTSLTQGKTEGSDELIDKLDAAMLDAAKQAVALLSPDESKRLSQLGVQAMGFDALRMPEVRTALSLTSDQTAGLDATFADVDAKQMALDTALGAKLSKLKDPGPNGTDDERKAYHTAQQDVIDEFEPQAKAVDKLRRQGWDKFYASLSTAQKQAWHEERGKPF